MATDQAPPPAAPHRPPLAGVLERALSQLARLTAAPGLRDIHADDLLMERAWLSNARFRNGQSIHGTSRLLATADGTLAITLARPDDWALLPAWLESEQVLDREVGSESGRDRDEGAWRSLAAHLADRSIDGLIERGRLLGLAVARTGTKRSAVSIGSPLVSLLKAATRPLSTRKAPPRVVDLSALWAGPLCAHLLERCGAEVVKVESGNRPDGAREGNRSFYELLNQNKRSVTLELGSETARKQLIGLIGQADMVIEASRPRALRQLGIDTEGLLQQHPDLIWVSITGHGRAEPAANWVAFGDDAGVAAGLSDVMKTATGACQFAGDAVADPLTGVHAALAAMAAYSEARGGLIDLALTEVAAWCLAEEVGHQGMAAVVGSFAGWWSQVAGQPPRTGYRGRPVTGAVAELGEHTEVVFRELAESEAGSWAVPPC